MARRRWVVRLTAAAENDVSEILRWSADHFGERQAGLYFDTILAVLEELSGGPEIPGVRARDDIGKGLFTIHVARRGRKGRHFVLFRITRDADSDAIDALRVLHDAMDLSSHLPADD